MRASIIIVLVFAAGIVVATSENHNYWHGVKYHERPRVVREAARYQGAQYFGKRQSVVDAPMMNEHERILSTLLRYFPQGIPVGWLLSLRNPAFAAKLTQLLMDGPVDLTSIMDPANSETTWLY